MSLDEIKTVDPKDLSSRGKQELTLELRKGIKGYNPELSIHHVIEVLDNGGVVERLMSGDTQVEITDRSQDPQLNVIRLYQKLLTELEKKHGPKQSLRLSL